MLARQTPKAVALSFHKTVAMVVAFRDNRLKIKFVNVQQNTFEDLTKSPLSKDIVCPKATIRILCKDYRRPIHVHRRLILTSYDFRDCETCINRSKVSSGNYVRMGDLRTAVRTRLLSLFITGRSRAYDSNKYLESNRHQNNSYIKQIDQ